jgi:nucleoside-diphosphate-sugar epimerase
MKALVTGANGFIGKHLTEALLDKGHSVVAFDLHVDRLATLSASDRCHVVQGDLCDRVLQKQLMQGIDVVFHLASAHLQQTLGSRVYEEVNVNALADMLYAAREAGVKRFIHTGTVGIYGHVMKPPADETGPFNPQSIYGETKLKGEEVVNEFFRKTHFPVTILRPAWVYGPGCPRTAKLFRTIQKGHFIMIGRGENLRHPIYISDMIEAYLLAAEKEQAVGETFIIAGAKPASTRELVETIAGVLEKNPVWFSLPLKLAEWLAVPLDAVARILKISIPLTPRSLEFYNTSNAFNIGKAQRIMGFEPKVSLQEGMQRTRALGI